ncbi:MAG: hypothetical protein KBD76_06295 [Bacteriovorax sp.]|nr:hypothetical protein [Bacteriovorax sp.]
MSRTFIISDNDILNQLYVINLEVYLGTNVELFTSTDLAIKSIHENEKVDLIITVNMINGQDAAAILYDFLTKNKRSIPLVVVGKPEKGIGNTVIIPSSYNLQALLRVCAQILNVTAKAMAEQSVPEFYPIKAKFLMQLRDAPCPFYMQMKKGNEQSDQISYTLISKKGPEARSLLAKLAQEGVENFYVDKDDRLLVINHISKMLSDFMQNTDQMGIEEKSVILQTGFEFAIAEFTQNPEVAQEIMGIAGVSTKLMEEMVQEAPGLKALLSILSGHKDGYIYTHSLLASYVAGHIVKKVSWGGVGHIEKINFVLFFHDITLAPIYLKYPNLKYEEDLLFSSELTEKEKDVVLNHARLAAELILTFKKAPMGVDLLIKQHHGMTNGVGFAMEFKDDISPLSKIIIISEAFVEEYMKGKELDSNYQMDLKKMILELNLKFKKNSYKKIVETLESLKI